MTFIDGKKMGECEKKVRQAFEERMKDIRRLWKAWLSGENDGVIEEFGGSIWDYGLGIDFVETGTFKDQREPYIRFQLSYGGPQEEFRIYLNGEVGNHA